MQGFSRSDALVAVSVSALVHVAAFSIFWSDSHSVAQKIGEETTTSETATMQVTLAPPIPQPINPPKSSRPPSSKTKSPTIAPRVPSSDETFPTSKSLPSPTVTVNFDTPSDQPDWPATPREAPPTEVSRTPAPPASSSGATKAPPQAPVLLRMTAPVYPPAAQRDNIEGTTHLSIKVAADGTVASATVSKSSGSRLLDQEALQAVKTWQFQPASTGGKAIPSVVNAPVIFRLQ